MFDPSKDPSSSQPVTVSFPSGQIASRIVDLVVRKKPLGWSRNSYSSYYKPQYAIWLARELEELIRTEKPKVFRLNGKLKLNSLHLLITQAFMYLREETVNEDDKRKWNDLWLRVKVGKEKGVGVIVKFAEVHGDLPSGEDFEEKINLPKWRQEIEDYLNSNEKNPLHIGRLVLSNEQVAQLNNELDGLEGIMFKVSNKEIKIIKTL